MKISQILLSIFIGFLVCSCSSNSDEFSYEVLEINENYSQVENPEERWKSYNLANYAVEQHWIEEASLGNISTFVVGGKVANVDFGSVEETSSGENYLQYYGKKRYEEAKSKVATIDTAFELIEEYQKKSNYAVEVEYHPRFGYPTLIDISLIQEDSEVFVADADIKVVMNNLKKISAEFIL